MQIKNGWDVYLKIKELSRQDGAEKVKINTGRLARELEMREELVREYVTALAVLDFVTFTDGTKEVFVITDLGNG